MAPEALPPAGGDQPHDNLQPYLTFYFCIALQGGVSAEELMENLSFTLLGSPFSVRVHVRFAVRSSQFAFRSSWFAVRSFAVRHSGFGRSELGPRYVDLRARTV